MITPKFKHDCKQCKFVGRINGCDAYVCTSSVVLRHGDDGPAYGSMPIEMAAARRGSVYNIILMLGDRDDPHKEANRDTLHTPSFPFS